MVGFELESGKVINICCKCLHKFGLELESGNTKNIDEFIERFKDA